MEAFVVELKERGLLPDTLSIEVLPGDASSRCYARLHSETDMRTWILMKMAGAEAFKSEEASASHQKVTGTLDFVEIGRVWKRAGVRVPEIFYEDPQSRFLLLEDFGEELLFDLRKSNPDEALRFYGLALRELVKIQSLQASPPVSDRSFSQELYEWEFHHFYEYALEKRMEGISKAEAQVLKSWMKDSSRKLSQQRACVVHRDFHSKNILVDQGSHQIGVIDFQDALMGSRLYDLASLLRDSYVDFDPKEETELLGVYESESGESVDRELFNLTALQRNMKAVGRFFYISMVKNKDTHLPFVGPTMKKVFKTLEALEEKPLLEVLGSFSWD